MNDNREQLTQQIIDAGRFLYGRGWSPATSSNYSARLDEQRALLTVSGKHKGQLGFDDVLATDLAGNSLEPGKKPSAETLLHTQLYAWNPAIGAVLHTHSVNATVLSRLVRGDRLVLQDYELQKALRRGHHPRRPGRGADLRQRPGHRPPGQPRAALAGGASALSGVFDPRPRAVHLGRAHERCPASGGSFRVSVRV